MSIMSSRLSEQIRKRKKEIHYKLDGDSCKTWDCKPIQKNYEIKEDEEYLEKEFPKGKTEFRGQAMVLLALARIQGSLSKEKDVLRILDERTKLLKKEMQGISEPKIYQYYARINELKEIKQKIGEKK